MKPKTICIGISLSMMILYVSCARQNDFPVLKGPYLGQKPPGMTPEIFAPGIVSSEHQEHSSLAFSPGCKEMWWSRWRLPYDMDKYPQVIIFIRYEKGAWSPPKVAPFSGKYRDGGPAFSPDGNRIYFYSRRPIQDDSKMSPDNNIWYAEKTRDGWSRPVRLGPVVNSSGEDGTPSVAANGNLYFTSVSPDGEFLFFTKFTEGGHEDFYWVSAKIIEDLKPEEHQRPPARNPLWNQGSLLTSGGDP